MENSIRYTGEHISVEDFSTELVKRIKDLYNAAEQSIDISYGVAMKNNKPLNAVGVGFMDSNTGPVIYVDDIYKEFTDGKDMGDIVNDAVLIIEHAKKNAPTLNNLEMDDIKNNLFVELINKEMNTTIAGICAHQDINDLMIIPRYKCIQEKDKIGSFIVSRKFQTEILQMTDDELLNIAKKNTFNQEYLCKGAYQTMGDTLGIDLDMPMHEKLYVLSNSKKLYGATALVNPKVMNNVQETINEKEFFIIPSSIHEVMIVPSSFVDDPADLKGMIAESNDDTTTINNKDILSYNIYRYNGKKLQICNSLDDLFNQTNREKQTETVDNNMKRGIKSCG